jgi:beta-glucanase (GH16 family)
MPNCPLSKRLKSVGAPFLVTIAVVTCVTTTRQTAAQIPDVPGWELFWHDEFDGTNLNTTNWTALNRQDSFNNEKQYYWPGQVTVANGNLQLTAINQPRGTKQYQSGLITSNALYGPGRFEARIDLPTTQGMWPAFWMNPNQVQWPLGGEIDILENRGSQPTIVSSAFHWQKDPGPCCGSHRYVSHNYTATSGGNPVNFHTGFHTYTAEWDKNLTTNVNEVRYYVDGNLHFTVAQNSSMSDANFTTAKNIIVNLAVGGDFGGDPNGTTIFPQTMLIDYVRVWHRPTGLPGDYNGDAQVDSEDYIAWRKSGGQSGIGLPADGSGNGTVGLEDYEVWRRSFGSSSSLGAGTSTALNIPEPHSAVLTTISLIIIYSQRSRSRAHANRSEQIGLRFATLARSIRTAARTGVVRGGSDSLMQFLNGNRTERAAELVH